MTLFLGILKVAAILGAIIAAVDGIRHDYKRNGQITPKGHSAVRLTVLMGAIALLAQGLETGRETREAREALRAASDERRRLAADSTRQSFILKRTVAAVNLLDSLSAKQERLSERVAQGQVRTLTGFSRVEMGITQTTHRLVSAAASLDSSVARRFLSLEWPLDSIHVVGISTQLASDDPCAREVIRALGDYADSVRSKWRGHFGLVEPGVEITADGVLLVEPPSRRLDGLSQHCLRRLLSMSASVEFLPLDRACGSLYAYGAWHIQAWSRGAAARNLYEPLGDPGEAMQFQLWFDPVKQLVGKCAGVPRTEFRPGLTGRYTIPDVLGPDTADSIAIAFSINERTYPIDKGRYEPPAKATLLRLQIGAGGGDLLSLPIDVLSRCDQPGGTYYCSVRALIMARERIPAPIRALWAH